MLPLWVCWGPKGPLRKGCQMVETEPSLFLLLPNALASSQIWISNLLAAALRGVALIWLRPGLFWYLWLCLLPFPIFVAAKGRLLSSGHDYEPAFSHFQESSSRLSWHMQQVQTVWGCATQSSQKESQFFKQHLSGIDLERSSVQDL